MDSSYFGLQSSVLTVAFMLEMDFRECHHLQKVAITHALCTEGPSICSLRGFNWEQLFLETFCQKSKGRRTCRPRFWPCLRQLHITWPVASDILLITTNVPVAAQLNLLWSKKNNTVDGSRNSLLGEFLCLDIAWWFSSGSSPEQQRAHTRPIPFPLLSGAWERFVALLVSSSCQR